MRMVLDTCALVWASCAPDRLATDAAELLASPVAEYVVSSISLWEIALKHHRGQLDLGISPKAFLARLHKMANMEIVDVTAGIWLASVALDWEHRDPADRVIVATAVSGNLPIVTRDQRILDFYAETIQA